MKKLLTVLSVFLVTAGLSVGTMIWTELIRWEDLRQKLGWAESQSEATKDKPQDDADAKKPMAVKTAPVSEEKALSAVVRMQQLMADTEKKQAALLVLQKKIQKEMASVEAIKSSILTLANVLLTQPGADAVKLEAQDFADAKKIAGVVNKLDALKKHKDTFPKWVEAVTKMGEKEAAQLVSQMDVPTAAALLMAMESDNRVKILEEMEAQRAGEIVQWTLNGEMKERQEG